ncbi:protein kinase domain-containing protein [Rhodococcus aetherivorans]|uniref:protein kinase domain-containing protein n=1 Tax=Rhodococcus aetherivorans TaxID=191292 RepID=UPI000622C722|nr:protein kinase [Rhodococcus aetherivorans]AKE87973.1 protein kinase [Rhodococcus aetherivorans]
MADVDPYATQRGTVGSVAAELAAAGFGDAREIGRGGFGIVYRCTQTALERTVAVKVLTADLDEPNRARFLREQRAAGRLTGHPHIVNVLHVDITDTGRPFLVMPYHAQGSVAARIRRHGPLPLEEALRLGVKIAGALATAHHLGIVHRDVKPGNILLTDYGEPALTDFGIAHITGGFVTTTGVVTGSPAYTAPEVIAGAPPSPAADVYGLGATLFTALTGHAAFERRSGEQVMAQFLRITAEPVPDPRQHGVPEDVSALIEEAMAGDPAHRPSAAQLGQRLREIQRRHGFPVSEMALQTEAEPDSASPGREAAAKEPAPARHAPSAPVGEAGRTGALPLELTSFVDRRTELAETTRRLSSSRLVTLTGIGGVGKTRLAVRVAATTHEQFPDGVWLVELGELRDESLVAGVVAGTLGLRDASARPPQQVLVDFLAPRRALVVLDNCEQVVAAVTALAEAVLRVCPQVRLLATSRERLGIGGEAVLPVPPLPVPDPDRLPAGRQGNDAMALFAERAAEIVPGFELTANNTATVARICRRLDGLPLPIELAAARLRAMSLEQILGRLTDRFALLTRGSRGAPSRQQTLRTCLDWSHELCTPVEQRVWAQLAVFAGSVDLDAAAQVCDLPADELLDTISSLVDKSILTREDAGAVVRFRMLETVRDYGREKAQESGEILALRRRHRRWYERLAVAAEADWISARQLEWITTLKRELPNLREALEFCVSDDPEAGLRTASALFPFWFSQGLFGEGRRWLDRFLADSTGHPTIDRAKAIYADSMMAGLQGDLRASIALVEQGRALVDQTTEPMLRAHVDLADGYLALFGGHLPEARAYFQRALDVFVGREDLLLQVVAVGILGVVFELLDETELAVECYERVLAMTEAHEEVVYRSYTLWALAIAVWRRGDHGHAVRLLGQALEACRRVNDRLNASICVQAMAWIAADEHEAQRAVVLMGAAEQLSRSVGSPSVFFPDLLTYQDEWERTTRGMMSDHAFAAARRQGGVLGFDAVLAYALGEKTLPATLSGAGSAGKLTRREREVSELIAQGATNKQIAIQLGITPRTTQGHIHRLMSKLGVTSRGQIAAWVVAERGQGPHGPPD